MSKRKNEGFLLTFVIVALALMGAIMFVLTDGANTMLFHADTAYLQAAERNLVASGLAWAQATIAAKGAAAVGEPVELSTGAFEAPSSRLTVRIARVQDRQATVGITASCSKGRRTLHTARDYTIDLP